MKSPQEKTIAAYGEKLKGEGRKKTKAKAQEDATKTSASKAPSQPGKTKKLKPGKGIEEALERLGNKKLERLYYSLCSIDLHKHTQLLSIGVWAFFETLTACAGRSEGAPLDGYFSKSRLQEFGVTGGFQTYYAAIKRIQEAGNTTKHHPTGAHYNGEQLNNDFVIFHPLILKTIEAVETL